MKNIRELSEFLGISRVALYRKIRVSLKEELTGHVIKIGNLTHVDDEGEEIIIKSLTHEKQEILRTNSELACTDLVCTDAYTEIAEPELPELRIATTVSYQNDNFELVDSLKAELAEKNKLISELMKQNVELINIFNVHDSLQIQEKMMLLRMHELSNEVHKPRFFFKNLRRKV